MSKWKGKNTLFQKNQQPIANHKASYSCSILYSSDIKDCNFLMLTCTLWSEISEYIHWCTNFCIGKKKNICLPLLMCWPLERDKICYRLSSPFSPTIIIPHSQRSNLHLIPARSLTPLSNCRFRTHNWVWHPFSQTKAVCLKECNGWRSIQEALRFLR